QRRRLEDAGADDDADDDRDRSAYAGHGNRGRLRRPGSLRHRRHRFWISSGVTGAEPSVAGGLATLRAPDAAGCPRGLEIVPVIRSGSMRASTSRNCPSRSVNEKRIRSPETSPLRSVVSTPLTEMMPRGFWNF